MTIFAHVVVINANYYLDPQSTFLSYILYDVNCEWLFFIIVFFLLLLFAFVSLLTIYTGALKLTNSIILRFIRYENSAENIKIDTEHKI